MQRFAMVQKQVVHGSSLPGGRTDGKGGCCIVC